MLFNQPRAERIMARDGIDAIVATSPDNVMYATDYECITQALLHGSGRRWNSPFPKR